MAKLARASATHVAFAFLAMGGWALFANRAHGGAAILPALAQGLLSGVITFVLKRALEWLAARLAGWRAIALPPLITASAILATLVAVHLAIGTPEIAATIAVPWSVSTLYAFVYSALLGRGRRGRRFDRA
jgi:fructose-specific phosphotransferase system IIC component